METGKKIPFLALLVHHCALNPQGFSCCSGVPQELFQLPLLQFKSFFQNGTLGVHLPDWDL